VEAPPYSKSAQSVSAENPPTAIVYVGGFPISLSLHVMTKKNIVYILKTKESHATVSFKIKYMKKWRLV